MELEKKKKSYEIFKENIVRTFKFIDFFTSLFSYLFSIYVVSFHMSHMAGD